MKLFHKESKQKKETRSLPMGKKSRSAFAVYAALVIMLCCCTTTAFAASDPLTVINNLSDFIFGLIRAVGMILLGFGVVQIGLSLKSHDPSQRANGFLTLAGGVVITVTVVVAVVSVAVVVPAGVVVDADDSPLKWIRTFRILSSVVQNRILFQSSSEPA